MENTKVILKRIAVRLDDLDENDRYYFEDYKTKGKILFYPFEPNGKRKVEVYCKRKGSIKNNCVATKIKEHAKTALNNKIKSLMIKD